MISEDFRQLSEDFRRFSKIVPKARQTFPNMFWKFPKIPEDVRRFPKTFEEDPKMFLWYTNEFKYNLRNKLDISEIIDIFTCEDIISSHVRISYRFYQFDTTRYTTDFYIISIGNRPNASAFRDIWARVMFFKFSKLHEPQASAIWELEKHHEWPYITKCTSDHTIYLFIIFSAKFFKKSRKRDRHASMDTQLWNGFQTLPNCSHVLFRLINYNRVTSPVPELSFLPAPYRGWTRAGERRVQDNLHAHARNKPIKNYWSQPRCSRQCVAQCLFQLALWKKTFSLTLILS